MTGLEVLAATVSINGKMLIDRVTFTAAPGQLTGLIGPNGAGKSTVMRAVLGLQAMTSGTIRFAGADLPSMPRRERARFSAFVEQSATTDTHLSGRDVVMLGRIPFQSAWQSTPSPEDEHAVTSALETVVMGDFGARAYQTLSGGEQQRLQIARALAQEPRLLLLDEPTNHLDVNAQLATLSLMRERAKIGSTILLALHDLNLAATYCDALVILYRGKVAACGAPDEVLTPDLLREVYQVNADVLRHPRTGRPILAYHSPL